MRKADENCIYSLTIWQLRTCAKRRISQDDSFFLSVPTNSSTLISEDLKNNKYLSDPRRILEDLHL